MENTNYLLAGNSEFLKEEALEKIKGQNLIERFDAQESTVTEVLDVARTIPLFSDKRVVIFRDVDRLDQNPLSGLISYLKTPNPKTTLILITQDEKISPSWLESFKELCQVHLLNVPYENQLEAWILERTREAGKKMDWQGARLLKELIGSDLRTLSAEIQKLVLYVDKKPLINVEDVEYLVTHSIHYSSFAFGDAFSERNLPKTLSVLSRLVDQQKTIPEAMGLVVWQLQKMIQAKLGLQQEGHPFFIRKLQQHLSQWTLHQLKQAVSSLLEVDLAIKTGRWPARLALEDWLVFILRQQVA